MEMGNYKHLLLAVDFEPNGTPVIERARQLCAQLGARLSLLHVLEPVMPPQEYMPLGCGAELPLPDDIGLEHELMELSQRQLDAIGDDLGVAAGDRLVRIGSTGHTIDAVAAEIGADLVVVGSHGRHGFMRLFGSTSKAVLGSLTCDVLCVKLSEGDGA